MQTVDTATAGLLLDALGELIEASARKFYGDDCGFVLMICHAPPEDNEGTRILVATNMCRAHAAHAMHNIAHDYATRDGFTLEISGLTRTHASDDPQTGMQA